MTAHIAVSFAEIEAAIPAQAIVAALVIDADAMFAAAARASNLVSPTRYADGDAVFASAATATNTLHPARLSDADAFRSASVAAVKVVAPARLSDADSLFAAAATSGRNLQPALVADADMVFAVSTGRGIRPALYSDADTVFAGQVIGAQTFTASRLVKADRFPAASVGRQRKRTNVQVPTGISRAGSAPNISRQKPPSLSF